MKSIVLCLALGVAVLGIATPAEAHIEQCLWGVYIEVPTSLVHVHVVGCDDPENPADAVDLPIDPLEPL